MGNQAVKEWGPIVLKLLPVLHTLHQKVSKDQQQKTDEKAKINEALKLMDRYQHNYNLIVQNQAEMIRTIEGLRLMVNHIPQNRNMPPHGTVPQVLSSGPIPVNGIIAGNLPVNGLIPGNTTLSHETGTYSKPDIQVTVTQQQLEELLTILCRTLVSEVSRNAGSDNPPAFNPTLEELDLPSAPTSEFPLTNDKGPLEHLLCCDICGFSFNKEDRKPIILPECGHTFCRSCIINISRRTELHCPTCRKMYRVPVENLPINYTVLSLLTEDKTIQPVNGTQAAIDPSRMSFDEQMEYALRLSQVDNDEKSFQLAQQLQEEEIASLWSKGKKHKKKKADGLSHGDNVDSGIPNEHDGMNAYYSARQLMEESDEDYQQPQRANIQEYNHEDNGFCQGNVNDDFHEQVLSNSDHEECENFNKNKNSSIHLESETVTHIENNPQTVTHFSQKSKNLLPVEEDLEDYIKKNFYGREDGKNRMHSETLNTLVEAVEKERHHKEKKQRKAERLYKEQLDLAIALSLSLQDTDESQDKEKDYKDEDY